VNWQASFRTPDHVRREWATEHGLSEITSERYTSALDAVCTRLGVTTGAALIQNKDRSPGARDVQLEGGCGMWEGLQGAGCSLRRLHLGTQVRPI
jgi:hypothetical protein